MIISKSTQFKWKLWHRSDIERFFNGIAINSVFFLVRCEAIWFLLLSHGDSVFEPSSTLCKLKHFTTKTRSIIIFTKTGNACKTVNDAIQLTNYIITTANAIFNGIARLFNLVGCERCGYCSM